MTNDHPCPDYAVWGRDYIPILSYKSCTRPKRKLPSMPSFSLKEMESFHSRQTIAQLFSVAALNTHTLFLYMIGLWGLQVLGHPKMWTVCMFLVYSIQVRMSIGLNKLTHLCRAHKLQIMYYNCFTVCMLVLRRVDRLYHHLFFQLTIERINIRVVRLPNLTTNRYQIENS